MAVMVILCMAATGMVQAGDDAVFLSTGSAEYRFAVHEESRIPVSITNNMGQDLPGIIHVSICDPVTGEYVYSQSKQITAFSGEEQYYLSAGNFGEEQNIIVDISFEYGTGPVYRSELKGIGLSFTDEQLPEEESKEERPDTTPITSTSGIKSEDTSMDTSSYQPYAAYGEVHAVEEHADADALRRTLLEEQIEREILKNALRSAIKDDILFQGVNSSLYDQNFSRLSLAVTAQGNTSGAFSSIYRDTSDETVSLSGTVNEGRITNIFENTTAAIALPGMFTDNETFRRAVSAIVSEGFVRTGTEMNTSTHYSDVKVRYDKGIYHAEIRAESIDGNVTAVDLKKDDILPFYILPLLILVFASLNALIVYAYYMMKPGDTETAEPDTTGQIRSPEDEMDLLRSAELLFANGKKKEAVSLAVRALRMHISSDQGAGNEISDRECREYLLANQDSEKREQALTILQMTEMQRFAEENVTEEQFRALIDVIKRLI